MKSLSTYIYIKGVKFHAFIGVSDIERKVGNDYTIDLRIKYPFQKAMFSDEVEDTLNYAETYNIIKQTMKKPTKLLEYSANLIIDNLKSSFPLIQTIDLKLTKLNPPMGADCNGAGVELHIEY